MSGERASSGAESAKAGTATEAAEGAKTAKPAESAKAADVSHSTALARLRVKFIALNMATAFVILAVVLTGICAAEWQRSVAEVDASLTTALESAVIQDIADVQAPPRIGDAGSDAIQQTAVSVAVYQVRGEGTATLVSGISGASLSDETLSAALQELDIDYSTMLITEGGEEAASADAAGDVDATGAADAAGSADSAGTTGTTGEASSTDAAGTTSTGTTDEAAAADTADAANSASTDPGAEAAELRDGGTSAPDATSPSETPTPQQTAVSIQQTGTMLGLCYAVATAGPEVYVAFADETATQGWQDLAFTLALGGLAALAVFFLISLAFSRWALRPVQAAWQRQRDFIADASHELKTPLTVVMADLDIVRGQRESTVAEQDKWLESAHHESERMQNLVQDMLELARLDADERMKGSERVSLSDLLEGELLEYESLFFERGVRLETEIAPEVNVEGNVQRLKRLVGTLADNACKYAGANGRVTVKLERESGKARLSVNNTGTPIPADDLPHVFDRFYRANHARTHEEGPGGTGLGLAIAHEIAAEHKGSISVASSADAGTTFTVTLPLAK